MRSTVDRPAATEPTISDVRHELRALRAEQAAQGAMLAEILRLLSRGRGPRDAADASFLSALVDIVGGGTFRAADVVERAGNDAAFAAVMEGADLVTEIDVGYVLRRCKGHVVGARRLNRVGRDERGAIWQFEPDDLTMLA